MLEKYLLSMKKNFIFVEIKNRIVMNLLLISNSTNFGETYLSWPMTQLESFCEKNNLKADSKIVFVPFAGVFINGNPYPQSYDAYTARVKKVFDEKLGLKNFVSVHEVENKIQLVDEAACIVVGGGNTFHLVAELHRYGLMDAISKVAKEGKPYIGWSAGSNIACPTLCTTNDMPIVQPASFNTLNLIPFQDNPHYLDPHPEIDKMIKHGGETRQDRINEYLAVNQNMKVVGLREASAIWVVGDKYYLKGGKKMMVFKYGTEPLELEPNSEITSYVI